jgi:hypothetical protein
VDRLLDEYAADVFNYINSAGDTFSPERKVPEELHHVYREIMGRFYDQLIRMQHDGCQSIHIVAHSLGTVVMYHALRGLKLDEATGNIENAMAEAFGRGPGGKPDRSARINRHHPGDRAMTTAVIQTSLRLRSIPPLVAAQKASFLGRTPYSKVVSTQLPNIDD